MGHRTPAARIRTPRAGDLGIPRARRFPVERVPPPTRSTIRLETYALAEGDEVGGGPGPGFDPDRAAPGLNGTHPSTREGPRPPSPPGPRAPVLPAPGFGALGGSFSSAPRRLFGGRWCGAAGGGVAVREIVG